MEGGAFTPGVGGVIYDRVIGLVASFLGFYYGSGSSFYIVSEAYIAFYNRVIRLGGSGISTLLVRTYLSVEGFSSLVSTFLVAFYRR